MVNYKFHLFLGNYGKKNMDYVEKLKQVLKDTEVDFDLEVTAVIEDPDKAEKYKIMATPTLMRKFPEPTLKVVGRTFDLHVIVN